MTVYPNSSCLCVCVFTFCELNITLSEKCKCQEPFKYTELLAGMLPGLLLWHDLYCNIFSIRFRGSMNHSVKNKETGVLSRALCLLRLGNIF